MQRCTWMYSPSNMIGKLNTIGKIFFLLIENVFINTLHLVITVIVIILIETQKEWCFENYFFTQYMCINVEDPTLIKICFYNIKVFQTSILYQLPYSLFIILELQD